MKNKIIGALTIILLTAVAFFAISPAAFAEESDTEAIAERIRAKLEKERAVCDEENDFSEEDVLKNQAASQDSDRLKEYFVSHKDGELYRHYAGHYINEEQTLTILLSCEESGCSRELAGIGFETEIEIRRGDFGSYFETKAMLDEINSKISQINLAVLHEEGTDKEVELMNYYPCTHYEHLTNSIWISVAAQDQEAEEHAVLLFKELVGDYPELTYGTCGKENVTAEDYTTVNPAVGDILYKSGGSSFRTSATISSVNSAGYISGVYFSDLIAVPGSIAGGGDSGGIAYKLLYGSNMAGILGIVKGGDDDVTLFIKASNINNILGIGSY